jgi:hypothetical protein
MSKSDAMIAAAREAYADELVATRDLSSTPAIRAINEAHRRFVAAIAAARLVESQEREGAAAE